LRAPISDSRVGDAATDNCPSVITSVGEDERDEDEARSLSGCVDCLETPEPTDPLLFRRPAEDIKPAGKP
jgi:hypothetical protein